MSFGQRQILPEERVHEELRTLVDDFGEVHCVRPAFQTVVNNRDAVWSNNSSVAFCHLHSAFVLGRVRRYSCIMPWKQLLVWATGQIDEALRQKLEFVLEEKAEVSSREVRVAQLVSVALRGATGWRFELKVREMLG
jgi:hypothetical protein